MLPDVIRQCGLHGPVLVKIHINNVNLDDASCDVVEPSRCEKPFHILHAGMGMGAAGSRC